MPEIVILPKVILVGGTVWVVSQLGFLTSRKLITFTSSEKSMLYSISRESWFPGFRSEMFVRFIIDEGMAFESWLFCIYSTQSPVKLPISVGMAPESRLFSRCNSNRLSRSPIPEGMGSDRWLSLSHKMRNVSRLEIVAGIAPVSSLWLSRSSRNDATFVREGIPPESSFWFSHNFLSLVNEFREGMDPLSWPVSWLASRRRTSRSVRKSSEEMVPLSWLAWA